MRRFLLLVGLIIATCSANAGSWQTITFEGSAPSAGLEPIFPGAPYDPFPSVFGFYFESAAGESAVFDSEWPNGMIGNDTDWLGFSSNDIVTLRSYGSAFHLASLLIGPTTLGDIPVEITITGNFWGGVVDTEIFTNLFEATMVNLNWEDLLSVEFSVSGDLSIAEAGIDDLRVNRVPVPATLALFVFGLVGLGWSRRRAKLASERVA